MSRLKMLVLIGFCAAVVGGPLGWAGSPDGALPDCPVMGEPINLAVSTPTPQGPVFLCCDGCVKKYTKNPDKYASAITEQRRVLADRPKVQVTCPVSNEPVNPKVGITHEGSRVSFCCEGCVTKFQKNPAKYTTALANSYTYQTKCPVMGETVDPTSFTSLSDGRKIYYCCDACESKLFGNPAKYAPKLASQGFQYNWAKIKKASDSPPGDGHGHDHHGHGHDGHDHGDH